MSSVSTIGTATNIQMDYMKLLIAQLQYQNPLEPLDNNEMALQLAQFSQLQQLEAMNSNFAQVLTTVQHSYADSLIGREVSYLVQTETGIDTVTGVVEKVLKNLGDGEIYLVVGDNNISLEQIISVN